jgi:ketosteroid isomerase-like protein
MLADDLPPQTFDLRSFFQANDLDHASKLVEGKHVDVIMQAYGFLLARNFDGMFEHWHDDSEFQILGSALTPFTGICRGKSLIKTTVSRNFGQLADSVPKIEHVRAQGDWVAVQAVENGTLVPNKTPYRIRWLHLYRFREDRIVALRQIIDSTNITAGSGRVQLPGTARPYPLVSLGARGEAWGRASSVVNAAAQEGDYQFNLKALEQQNANKWFQWTSDLRTKNRKQLEAYLVPDARWEIRGDEDFIEHAIAFGKEQVLDELFASPFDLTSPSLQDLFMICQGNTILTCQRETGHCPASNRTFETFSVQTIVFADGKIVSIEKWYDGWPIVVAWLMASSREGTSPA